MKATDRVLGILLLVLAVAYGWGATQFPVPFAGPESVGPSTFPKALAVIMGLCSLYLVVKPDESQPWGGLRVLGELGLALTILAAYILLLEPFGFIPATTLAVGALCWRMGVRPLKACMTGLLSGTSVFLLFTFGLELALPTGILELH
ncbi:hypothetical protein GCM10011348_02020 [Marinobacterium nitratireducens]|uniref:DUF1468 domain-containing protein n=1 Tax=Marinobacterium nitratireducens TaxID=518897 RepID=A0A917Z789_9GAMM|nr:tripartite tricarboxylate transporter TctB family protein [Marinobacterium nitratireducens]GGO75960.1 hypothetical protein GCM10011348_02020 [Marinobacterium nitratireducens]